jgi:hypothetical protein
VAFTEDSTIEEVIGRHPDGRGLLYEHGYDLGDGFVDILSQSQSLLSAERWGRLRDLAGLLARLNRG